MQEAFRSDWVSHVKIKVSVPVDTQQSDRTSVCGTRYDFFGPSRVRRPKSLCLQFCARQRLPCQLWQAVQDGVLPLGARQVGR